MRNTLDPYEHQPIPTDLGDLFDLADGTERRTGAPLHQVPVSGDRRRHKRHLLIGALTISIPIDVVVAIGLLRGSPSPLRYFVVGIVIFLSLLLIAAQLLQRYNVDPFP